MQEDQLAGHHSEDYVRSKSGNRDQMEAMASELVRNILQRMMNWQIKMI